MLSSSPPSATTSAALVGARTASRRGAACCVMVIARRPVPGYAVAITDPARFSRVSRRAVRALTQGDGVYSPEVRSQLQELIRQNKTAYPKVFKK